MLPLRLSLMMFVNMFFVANQLFSAAATMSIVLAPEPADLDQSQAGKVQKRFIPRVKPPSRSALQPMVAPASQIELSSRTDLNIPTVSVSEDQIKKFAEQMYKKALPFLNPNQLIDRQRHVINDNLVTSWLDRMVSAQSPISEVKIFMQKLPKTVIDRIKECILQEHVKKYCEQLYAQHCAKVLYDLFLKDPLFVQHSESISAEYLEDYLRTMQNQDVQMVMQSMSNVPDSETNVVQLLLAKFFPPHDIVNNAKAVSAILAGDQLFIGPKGITLQPKSMQELQRDYANTYLNASKNPIIFAIMHQSSQQQKDQLVDQVLNILFPESRATTFDWQVEQQRMFDQQSGQVLVRRNRDSQRIEWLKNKHQESYPSLYNQAQDIRKKVEDHAS